MQSNKLPSWYTSGSVGKVFNKFVGGSTKSENGSVLEICDEPVTVGQLAKKSKGPASVCPMSKPPLEQALRDLSYMVVSAPDVENDCSGCDVTDEIGWLSWVYQYLAAVVITM